MRALFFKKSLFPTLSLVMSMQFCNSILSPVWVFLFFSLDSGVFASHASMATRSLWYGVTLGLSYWLGMLSNILLGMVSDRYGRKKLFILTLLGFLIASGLALMAQKFHAPIGLLLAMVLLGSSFMAVQAGLARVGDLGDPKRRLKDMAYLQCVVSIGATLGPWVGGYLASSTALTGFLYHLPFLAVMVISIILLIFLKYDIEPKSLFSHRSDSGLDSGLDSSRGALFSEGCFQEIKHILKNPTVRMCLLILVLSQFSWATYYEFAPALLKILFHATPVQVGRFEGMIALWLILATAWVLHILQKYGSPAFLIRLCVVWVLIGVLMALIASLDPEGVFEKTLIWLSAIPTAMGDVMLYSMLVTTLSKALGAHLQGKVMGFLYVIIGISWSLSGLLGGVLMAHVHNGPLWFAPLGSLILFVLLLKKRWLAVLTEGIK